MELLRIDRARAEHSGKGIVLLHPEVLEREGLKADDPVELRTRFGRTALARVGPSLSSSEEQSVVCVDQYIRQGIKARLGDTLEVSAASNGTGNVEKLELAPLLDVSDISGAIDYLKQSWCSMGMLVYQDAVIYAAFPGAGLGLGTTVTTQADDDDEEGHGHGHGRGGGHGHGGAGGPALPTVMGAPFQVTEISPGPGMITPDTEIELRYAMTLGAGAAPEITYEDVGGMEAQIRQVRELIEIPLRHPNIYRRLGINPPRGIIFHGPPGSGKTHLARAIAHEIDAQFLYIGGPEVIGSGYGESEDNLRRVFEQAARRFPSIILVDELDIIAPKRGESGTAADTRLSTQFLSLLDGIKRTEGVMIIGTSNRIDSVDMAFRRPGRFDRELYLGAPDSAGRLEILHIHTRGMPLSEDAQDFLPELARISIGFVGADFLELCREAGLNALRRTLPKGSHIDMRNMQVPLENLIVNRSDLEDAVTRVRPSALRETMVVASDTTWDDVGGLEDAKERLREVVEQPLRHAEVFSSMKIVPPKGVLLYGPSGTGKSLLAKAVAYHCDANFIPVRGPEFFSKWLGESEERVRRIFGVAAQVAPAIIFLDQLDALAPARSDEAGTTNIIQRIVNQLMAELDAVDPLKGIMVIAATNRVDLVDTAVLTPGRFGVHIYVPLPDEQERVETLKIQLQGVGMDASTSLDEVINTIAGMTGGYSGAELAAVCEEAKMAAVRSVSYSRSVPLHMEMFLSGLEKVQKMRDDRQALEKTSAAS
jgi:transitional endoplasmic reticulum ATPase